MADQQAKNPEWLAIRSLVTGEAGQKVLSAAGFAKPLSQVTNAALGWAAQLATMDARVRRSSS